MQGIILRSKGLLLFIIVLSFVLTSCSKKGEGSDRIVVAITADVETINPLFAFSINEANIDELLFLSLVKHKWDNEKGELTSEPMLAKNWQWNADSSAITLELRDNAKWSDGQPITSDDVVYSFDLYSDTTVQSYMFGSFENFYTDKAGQIISEKTFDVLSPEKLTIKFKEGSNPSLFNIDFPIIPKHVFEKIDRKEIANAPVNSNPVTSGPFKLNKWMKNQYVIIEKNPESFLVNDNTVNQIVFKVVPEYNSRISQLKNGEIDMMEYVKTDDIDDIKKINNIATANVSGREYDYVGWSNINRDAYNSQKKIEPNFFFGSGNVRIALTHAINRAEILKTYLKDYGSICTGPVSPIFKGAQNPDLKPYEYKPGLAKEMLAKEGWTDSNNDGILDKSGRKFEFTLTIPSGNPRRSYAATVIKQNLSEIGISVNIESIELGTFINQLSARKMDAWMAGWIIPLPADLGISWNSDLLTTPYNFFGYQNKNVDELLSRYKKSKDEKEKNLILKNIQDILHVDEPATFMYWVDNIVAYNSSIGGLDINPLGVVHHCWNWSKNL